MHLPGQTAGLIEYGKFLHAIAKHRYPDPVDMPALPGVVGKHLFQPEIGVYSISIQLTVEDETTLRELIEKHTDILPSLRPVMDEQDIASFLSAFRGLSDRPEWEPVLRTKQDLEEIRRRRGDAKLQHDAALKKAIAQGHIRHFNIDRVPVMPHFELITYMPWEDAQAYLAPLALDLHLLFGPPTAASTPPGLAPFRSPHSALTDVTGNPPQHGAQRRRQWSTKDRQQIVELVRSDQSDLAESKFGISAQYARQLATRFEKEAAAQQPRPSGSPPQQGINDTDELGSTSSGAENVASPPSHVSADAHLLGTRGGPKPPGLSDGSDHSESTRNPPSSSPKVILRMPEVQRRTGLKNSSIYERLNPRSKYYDESFPRQVSLSGAPLSGDGRRSAGRAVGFIEDEIERWIATRTQR